MSVVLRAALFASQTQVLCVAPSALFLPFTTSDDDNNDDDVGNDDFESGNGGAAAFVRVVDNDGIAYGTNSACVCFYFILVVCSLICASVFTALPLHLCMLLTMMASLYSICA
jgi:hypothetical protein